MMKKFKFLSNGEIILLIISTLILSKSFVEGFNVGISQTSCDLDPSENNNACASLYDAECGGAHCRCPSGTHEHKALQKCVPGTASNPKIDEGFGDLPFDYVPGKKSESKQKLKPAQSPSSPPPVLPNDPSHPQAPLTGIRTTSCSLDPSENNNPCSSLYDAECNGAHCKCPSGTNVHKNLQKCVPGSAPKPKEENEFGDLPFDYFPVKNPETKPKSKEDDVPEKKPDQKPKSGLIHSFLRFFTKGA